jgi:YD repeat-containing protein
MHPHLRSLFLALMAAVSACHTHGASDPTKNPNSTNPNTLNPNSSDHPSVDAYDGPSWYAYDAAGRLVGVHDDAGHAAQYTYDAAGNILSIQRYEPDQRAVFSVTPRAARPNDEITISGHGFCTDGDATHVYFGTAEATVTSASVREIKVRVPAGAQAGPIRVSTCGADAWSSERFEPNVPVKIVSVSPTVACPNRVVTVTGQGFAPDSSANSVRVNGTYVPAIAIDQNTLALTFTPQTRAVSYRKRVQ